MNGLEALKKIENSYREQKKKLVNDPFIHLHEHLWFLTAENELKAFEIIKAKKVETYHLSRCKTLIEYNSAWDIGGMDLTQDEFDLLKEVLE